MNGRRSSPGISNINRLAHEGKLAVAGPFGKNDKSWRGLYIFNVPTIEKAEKLVILDPAGRSGSLRSGAHPLVRLGRDDGGDGESRAD